MAVVSDRKLYEHLGVLRWLCLAVHFQFRMEGFYTAVSHCATRNRPVFNFSHFRHFWKSSVRDGGG